MIYFAEMVGHKESPIKIGESNKPYNRIKQQQTGNPYILEVVATMPGNRDTEKSLHDRFSEWQCEGGTEWFDRNPELDALINDLKVQKKRRHSLLFMDE